MSARAGFDPETVHNHSARHPLQSGANPHRKSRCLEGVQAEGPVHNALLELPDDEFLRAWRDLSGQETFELPWRVRKLARERERRLRVARDPVKQRTREVNA